MEEAILEIDEEILEMEAEAEEETGGEIQEVDPERDMEITADMQDSIGQRVRPETETGEPHPGVP
jgi:hypothetical protein